LGRLVQANGSRNPLRSLRVGRPADRQNLAQQHDGGSQPGYDAVGRAHGAALIRESEHGTIEHLLVMPVTPFEIVTGKVLVSALFGYALARFRQTIGTMA